MFMAANSPLIQPRLQLLISQDAWILKPFPPILQRAEIIKNLFLLCKYG